MHHNIPLAAAMAVLLSAPCQAAQLTDTAAHGFSGTSSINFALDRFDPALGTLTAIALTVRGDVRRPYTIQRTGEVVQFLELTFPDNLDIRESIAFDKTFNVAAFQPYIGTSPLSFRAVWGGTGNFRADITYTYDAPLATVPVPASLPLVGLGLAALAWCRSRTTNARRMAATPPRRSHAP